MFKPGRELCGDFYWQAARPILDAAFPGVRHSAGLIGPGSEVLGFDDEHSADHDWGPRVLGADRFVEACRAAVADPQVGRLSLLGSIDQLADGTDLLSDIANARRRAGTLDCR